MTVTFRWHGVIGIQECYQMPYLNRKIQDNMDATCHVHLLSDTITMNQGGHWRCDYVTDPVFQEKSYKTNLHLFSACAGVVWRSVNINDCSQESIFLRECHMVIFIPFFIVTEFHFKFTHYSTPCATLRTVCLALNDSNNSVKAVDLKV